MGELVAPKEIRTWVAVARGALFYQWTLSYVSSPQFADKRRPLPPEIYTHRDITGNALQIHSTTHYLVLLD